MSYHRYGDCPSVDAAMYYKHICLNPLDRGRFTDIMERIVRNPRSHAVLLQFSFVAFDDNNDQFQLMPKVVEFLESLPPFKCYPNSKFQVTAGKEGGPQFFIEEVGMRGGRDGHE